ncbi:MAG: hypothetical protein ACT4QF_07045 [Sporichthyaceae bacterium]
MRPSLSRKPATALSLTFLLSFALAGCGGDSTSVETAGLSGVGSDSTSVPVDDPTPAPGSEKAKALEQNGPVDDETLAKGRDKYKKLKKAENANPLYSIVCKFPDGRFAGIVLRTQKPADPKSPPPEVPKAEKARIRHDFCKQKFNATWEEEDPA